MKKILMASLLLSIVLAPASFAEQKTYTGQYVQKHTQKLIDAEKQLQGKEKSYQEESAARQKARQEALEQQKKEVQAQQKARQDASNAQKEKIEKKKQLFNELISK